MGLCWPGPTLRGTRYGMAWLENKSNIPRVDIAFIGHKSHSNPTHDDGVNIIIYFKVVNNIINRSLKNDFYSFPGQQLQRTSQNSILKLIYRGHLKDGPILLMNIDF